MIDIEDAGALASPGMKLLGIPGSLRKESTNSLLLTAASHCMPEGVSFEIADCIGELPHFNPDVDVDSNEILKAWIQQVRIADGLVISTPEYASGYPGSLKNALDWLVQTDAHIEKPFMLLKASSRSSVAHDTLTVVLETMSGLHISRASMTVSLLGKALGVEEILATDDAEDRMKQAFAIFASEIMALGESEHVS